MIAHACDPCTHEVRAGESEVCDYPCVQSKFKASLRYMRKRKERKKKWEGRKGRRRKGKKERGRKGRECLLSVHLSKQVFHLLYVCLCMHTCRDACRGQRTSWKSWFSPIIWFVGMELRSSLGIKCPYPLEPSPQPIHLPLYLCSLCLMQSMK